MAPNNPLPIHGNEKTMNLNSLILTNIQSSPYFKVNLFELKTYHQVIDEIYYKVEHLEPWEKGSRKTAGQTGMCGGVRGVGAGGIVSSAYCLLYKLFTLKLTKKQVVGLITHTDSPYIRGLGFMYIRYTQNPSDLWDWYKPYLDDEEELDVKAGGGHVMQIGEMLRQWLTKLEWYSTLFPRIPVPIQKSIEAKLREYNMDRRVTGPAAEPEMTEGRDSKRASPDGYSFGEAERMTKFRESPHRGGSLDKKHDIRPSPPFDIAKAFEQDRSHSHSKDKRHGHDGLYHRSRDRSVEKKRSRSRDKSHRSSKDHHHRHHHHHRHESPGREHKRSHSKERRHAKHKHRSHRSRSRERSHRSRSRERSHRSRSKDRSHRSRSQERSHRSRSRERSHRSRSRERSHRSRERSHRSKSKDKSHRSRSRERSHRSDRNHRSRSWDKGHRESSFDRDLRLERERIKNGR